MIHVPSRPYPEAGSDHEAFLENLSLFAARVRSWLPAVQAVYTSSRSYGGFALNAAARGEPLSYEEGHALNTWLNSGTSTFRGRRPGRPPRALVLDTTPPPL